MNLIEISRKLQRSPATISAGIRQGVFPFAAAAPVRGTRNKTIFYPAKIEEYINATGEYDLSVKAVAKMMGVAPLTLQVFLQKKILPFGVAYKTREDGERYVYVIYPKKLEEYLIGRENAA